MPGGKQLGISRAEYARRCEVSRETVRKWERSGYLVVNHDGSINPDASDERRARMVRPKSDRPGPRAAAGPRSRAETSADDAGDVPDINASRARLFAAEAALKELKLEQERKRLGDLEQIRRHLFDLAAMIREGVMSIPARHAAALCAVETEHEMRRRLELACAEALRDLDARVQAFATAEA